MVIDSQMCEARGAIERTEKPMDGHFCNSLGVLKLSEIPLPKFSTL